MYKTASQIADQVLIKLARKSKGPGGDAALAGATNLILPVWGPAITASALAPEGSGVRQFAGTAVGSTLGAIPGLLALSAAIKGRGSSGLAAAGAVGSVLGGALGGWGGSALTGYND
jgi:hypothetical protein